MHTFFSTLPLIVHGVVTDTLLDDEGWPTEQALTIARAILTEAASTDSLERTLCRDHLTVGRDPSIDTPHLHVRMSLPSHRHDIIALATPVMDRVHAELTATCRPASDRYLWREVARRM